MYIFNSLTKKVELFLLIPETCIHFRSHNPVFALRGFAQERVADAVGGPLIDDFPHLNPRRPLKGKMLCQRFIIGNAGLGLKCSPTFFHIIYSSEQRIRIGLDFIIAGAVILISGITDDGI